MALHLHNERFGELSEQLVQKVFILEPFQKKLRTMWDGARPGDLYVELYCWFAEFLFFSVYLFYTQCVRSSRTMRGCWCCWTFGSCWRRFLKCIPIEQTAARPHPRLFLDPTHHGTHPKYYSHHLGFLVSQRHETCGPSSVLNTSHTRRAFAVTRDGYFYQYNTLRRLRVKKTSEIDK